jgi:hypothetical protein
MMFPPRTASKISPRSSGRFSLRREQIEKMRHAGAAPAFPVWKTGVLLLDE